MAKAMPGLQKIAGASLNHFRMTHWFVEVGYQLIPNLATAIWCELKELLIELSRFIARQNRLEYSS